MILVRNLLITVLVPYCYYMILKISSKAGFFFLPLLLVLPPLIFKAKKASGDGESGWEHWKSAMRADIRGTYEIDQYVRLCNCSFWAPLGEQTMKKIKTLSIALLAIFSINTNAGHHEESSQTAVGIAYSMTVTDPQAVVQAMTAYWNSPTGKK